MIDTRLQEPELHALALIRALTLNDAAGWQALRETDDMALVAYAAVEVAGVLAGMIAYEPGDTALDPGRVDRLLSDVSGALARNHADGA